jgi:CheY-like chemotaxis protein
MYRLLILEDEEIQRVDFYDCYREEIEAGTYELIFATTGEEALKIIEEDKDKKIDLIISDLRIPHAEIDGWKFIKTLAKRHIDIKTIIITAVGSLEDFTVEQRKNIVYLFKKNTPETDSVALKLFVKQTLSFPDRITLNSHKVRYNTLLKLTKDLSSKQKIQLIKEMLSYMNIKELRQIENQLDQWWRKAVEEAYQRDRIRQWLIEKEKTGEFQLPISAKDIDLFYIDENRLSSGIYYRVRWWQDGKSVAKHVPAFLSDELSLLLLSTNPHPSF